MNAPVSSRKLVLVRHGETPSNVSRVLDTQLPGAPLTDQGTVQARALGARLAPPAVLISSVALRAQQTAALLAAETGVPVQVLDGLHEVQVGDLEGRNDRVALETFGAIYLAWQTGDFAARPPGGESAHELLDRYLPAVAQVREQYFDGATANEVGPGDIVIVSHGAAIMLAGGRLAGLPSSFTIRNRLENTEFVELEPTPGGGWDCVRWGSHTPPFIDDGSPAEFPIA
jgi:probable phosphoglycerate mutase